MRVRPFAVAMALLVDLINKHIQRPDLPVMGMSADSDIDAKGVSLRESVRLMVKDERRTSLRDLGEKVFQRLAVTIRPVIPTYYI